MLHVAKILSFSIDNRDVSFEKCWTLKNSVAVAEKRDDRSRRRRSEEKGRGCGAHVGCSVLLVASLSGVNTPLGCAKLVPFSATLSVEKWKAERG